jgi:AhpD family alkylhydroperoxidase
LNKREREIAFVAASIASGCVSCLEYHRLEALSAGLSTSEIMDIAHYALKVRTQAEKTNLSSLDDLLTEESPNHDNVEKSEQESNCC